MPTYPTPKTYNASECAAMDGGASLIDSILNVSHIESDDSPSTLAETWYNFAQKLFDLIKASHKYSGLIVQENATTFGVFPIDYEIAGTKYSYAGATGVNPPDNATTYYYLDSSQTLDSVDSGAGWPSSEIHKLAEVTTDASGNITAITNVTARNFGRGAAASWSSYAAAANPNIAGYNPLDVGKLNFDATSELTIATGAITAVNSMHTVDTEANAASDDLDTVSGGVDGDVIFLFPENIARVVTVKNGTGNIAVAGGDYAMNAATRFIILVLKGSTWYGLPAQLAPSLLTGNLDFDGYNTVDLGLLNFDDAAELTIATGAITITQSYHDVDTEADAASDDLDTISGGTAGDLLILKAENTARSVVVKHSTGNIELFNGQDCTLDDTEKTLLLRFDGTNWCEVARSHVALGDFEGSDKAIPVVYTWVISGALAAGVWALKFKTPAEYDLEFVNAIGYANTAPAGAACIIDVQDDGASLFAAEAEMINIAAAANSDVSATKNSTVAGGSVLSIEVKSTGGSPNGAANGTVVANFRAPVKLGS